MKAFLSHSSKDKEFVRAVADKLGRQYTVFDERSFDTGIEFKKAIENGFDESCVFVLFASAASLQSLWVEFEIKEAWWRLLEKKLNESLVFIIDSSIEPQNLPKWLQRAKISRAQAPNPTARLIRDHLDSILSNEQRKLFIGRSEDIEAIQQTLTPWYGSEPPKVVAVTGLPGIGRRSLIRHISPSTLNLDRANVIKLEDGDTLADVSIKLADQVESFSTADGFKRIVESIRKLGDEDVIIRIVQDLQLCIHNRELPIFFDSGGLLDDDGRFLEVPQRILAALPSATDCYVFLVSNRRPAPESLGNIPVVSLKALKNSDAKSLISAVAHKRRLAVKPGEISELADYAGGFPPSCTYAVQLAVDYGLAALLANKHRLVEVRTLPFVKYLVESKLPAKEMEILRILAEYSPLPLSVLGATVKLEKEALSEHLVKLIDYSLVVPAREGFYAIAEPVADAVIKVTRLLINASEHSTIANGLKTFLDENELQEHAIDSYRLLFRAARNSSDIKLAGQALFLANDVIQLLERNYHARNYEEAVKLGREAVAMSPRSTNAHSFLIRALIQENMWADAEEALKRFQVVAPQRDALFLRGFLHRKKGEFSQAIDFFLRAEKAGRGGGALKRELASCYEIEGKLDEAEKYLQEALKNNWDNNFVVDLGVKIATQMKNEALALSRLEQLRAIESPAFYQHRLSHVEFSFGHMLQALEAARLAVQLESKPTFEMLGQLAACEIKTGGLDVAEDIVARLEQDFPRKRPDYRLTLRALIELERKHYSNALALLDKRASKSDAYYYHLRYKALKGEMEKSALADAKRQEYTKESEELERIIAGKPVIDINKMLDL